jgi:hypothetical protein
MFTERELDHLFMALILHTKMTREEQAEWQTARAEIWKKLVAASDGASKETAYRTSLFSSPELLRTFWRNPSEIQRAFSWCVNVKAKKAKA